MINLDDELSAGYLTECSEHLATMESDLLDLEQGGADIDEELVNRIFRALHSIKGGAGFFELVTIRELAHRAEDVLALIRSRKIVPTPDRVRVLLSATDKLRELIEDPGTSNRADVGALLNALAKLTGDQLCIPPVTGTVSGHSRPGGKPLRMLLVEDDFASRLVLQTFLSRYGECHVAVNGKEAVEAFRFALEHGQRYGLICMDIMMPVMDGREAVRQVRALEEEHGYNSTNCTKILMTTAVNDVKEVFRCFQDLCDGYLIKPIDLNDLIRLMSVHRLIARQEVTGLRS